MLYAKVTITDRNGNNDTRIVPTKDLSHFINRTRASGGAVEHIAVPMGTPSDHLTRIHSPKPQIIWGV